jgi:hypothetical protein
MLNAKESNGKEISPKDAVSKQYMLEAYFTPCLKAQALF